MFMIATVRWEGKKEFQELSILTHDGGLKTSSVGWQSIE